jgi:hypothetical protein
LQLTEAKVKVITECDVPQESTSLTVVIDEEIGADKTKLIISHGHMAKFISKTAA